MKIDREHPHGGSSPIHLAFFAQCETYRISLFWSFARALLMTLAMFAQQSIAKDGPTAARISPQVGQRGKTVKLLLEGSRLQLIQEVLFYDQGITFEGYEPIQKVLRDQHDSEMIAASGTAAMIRFAISEDCKLGEHFFRIRTNETLSELLSFWVTPYPCVSEQHRGHDGKTTNGTIETAQLIELNSTVYGYHPSYSTIDHDFYSFDLAKGQPVSIAVWSACLGFEHFRGITDTAITVYGPDKNRMAYSDDSSLCGMDPMLSFVAEQEGTHYIDIHQNMDFEGSLRHYAAHISSRPRPTHIFPLGGQVGTTVQARLIGDVRGDRLIDVKLPDEVGPFESAIIPVDGQDEPIPLKMHVVDYPSVLEDGKEHFSPETAQRYSGSLPVAFDGRIEHEGRTDWFRFSAKRGKRYRIRTYSASLGSTMDPKLWVRPAGRTKSRINIEADDSKWIDHDWYGNDRVWMIPGRMDPIVVFEPDADGDYLLGVADAQRLYGPDFVYRVEIQPLRDRAFIHFPHDYREQPNKRDCFVIPRGNTIEHNLSIIQGTGNRYQGDMKVIAKGLPKGVTFSCPDVQPGQKIVQATFNADASAEPWAGFIDLSLQPTDPKADFSGSYVYNVPSTQRRGGFNVVFNTTRKCALAVVDEAPIKVKVQQPKIGLAKNALIELKIDVQRTGGFKDAVQVYAQWLPNGVTRPPPLIIPAGETSGIYRLQAGGNAVPGEYSISLTAQEDSGGSRSWGTGYHYVASPPISLKVVDPYVEIKLARTAIERQKDGFIEAKVVHVRPLPSNATARLVRLPNGVELVAEQVIRPQDNTVRFPIRATKDCLVGQYKEITCEITIQDKGQSITQQTGDGMLRIDVERK